MTCAFPGPDSYALLFLLLVNINNRLSLSLRGLKNSVQRCCRGIHATTYVACSLETCTSMIGSRRMTHCHLPWCSSLTASQQVSELVTTVAAHDESCVPIFISTGMTRWSGTGHWAVTVSCTHGHKNTHRCCEDHHRLALKAYRILSGAFQEDTEDVL